ncbi:hypothetical protein HY522_04315 [bacterium]|nr:hypothetical protein [bacterium]
MNAKRFAALAICAAGLLPWNMKPAAAGIESLSLIGTFGIDTSALDVLFAEIADNSDSVIYLRKDSTDTSSDAWSFVLTSLSGKGDTAGEFRRTFADVFWGFTPGPKNTVLFTRDAEQAGGKRGVFAGLFSNQDSFLIVSNAVYPDYLTTTARFNFAFVRDTDLYIAAILDDDSPTLSVNPVRILDLAAASGTIRYPRWSPNAEQLVFTVEATSESQANIYMLPGVQGLSTNDTPITAIGDTGLKRITNDTYYNTFPQFVGDSYIIFSRANNRATSPHNFRFSGFSETVGFKSIAPAGTNWDILLYEINTGNIFPVDSSATTAALYASASHRGYTVQIKDQSDSEGDAYFSALRSSMRVNSTTAGFFHFPANVHIELEAGAAPTCSFAVTPDTPRSGVRSHALDGDMEVVLVPVDVTPSVPSDSFDILKVQLYITYTDADITGYVNLSNRAAIHDTGAAQWRGAGGFPEFSMRRVRFRPPHFSIFGISSKTYYTPTIIGSSCVLSRHWPARAGSMATLRAVRDDLLKFSWGRRAVRQYYRWGR